MLLYIFIFKFTIKVSYYLKKIIYNLNLILLKTGLFSVTMVCDKK